MFIDIEVRRKTSILGSDNVFGFKQIYFKSPVWEGDETEIFPLKLFDTVNIWSILFSKNYITVTFFFFQTKFLLYLSRIFFFVIPLHNDA